MPDVLPSWFPHPRFDRDRTGGAGLLSEFGVSIPQVRLWHFHLTTAGPTRTNLASPAFRGPAVVRDIRLFNLADGSVGTSSVFAIFHGQSPAINGTGLAVGVAPPGVNIFDLSYVSSLGFLRPVINGVVALGEGAHELSLIPIGRVITDSEFFLNLSYINTAAAASVGKNGMIRVYEHVDPDLVAGLVLA
jgi:hypothetical protein